MRVVLAIGNWSENTLVLFYISRFSKLHLIAQYKFPEYFALDYIDHVSQKYPFDVQLEGKTKLEIFN